MHVGALGISGQWHSGGLNCRFSAALNGASRSRLSSLVADLFEGLTSRPPQGPRERNERGGLRPSVAQAAFLSLGFIPVRLRGIQPRKGSRGRLHFERVRLFVCRRNVGEPDTDSMIKDPMALQSGGLALGRTIGPVRIAY